MLAAVPIAFACIVLLLVTVNRVPVEKLQKIVGFRGPMHVLPDITIVPNNQLDNMQRKERRLTTLSTVDIDLPKGHDLNQPQLFQNPRDQKTEKVDFPEFDDNDVSTRERHPDVPYSEDYIILKMVEPRYPPGAMKLGIEGSVLVQLLVTENGRVQQATVLSRVGPPSFERSALKAVRQFIFQPPRRNGVATSMWIKFLIKFRTFG